MRRTPITKPWLAGPPPDRVCPRAVLAERILNLLSTHDVAVVLTVITPSRVVYTDHWLRRSGFAPRQVWRAD